jgi:hypothetical protein
MNKNTQKIKKRILLEIDKFDSNWNNVVRYFQVWVFLKGKFTWIVMDYLWGWIYDEFYILNNVNLTTEELDEDGEDLERDKQELLINNSWIISIDECIRYIEKYIEYNKDEIYWVVKSEKKDKFELDKNWKFYDLKKWKIENNLIDNVWLTYFK